jgi:hypothetical protein
VDRVHGAGSQGPQTLIKWRSSIRWSTTWISIKRRVIFILILIIHPRSDGSGLSPPSSVPPDRTKPLGRHGRWRESSNSRYEAPNTTWFLPTRSRRWEEPVLHTYVGENRWWKTGNIGAVQTTLIGGDWLLRWSSSDKNRMNRLLTSPSCPSVLQFLRAVMNWTHTARNPWWLVFGACRTKFYEYESLFIGLLGPTRRGDGVLHFLSINQTLIRLRLEYFWSGMNFGLVTIWKPSSRLGLHRLRKIPYPESGHRVWSG